MSRSIGNAIEYLVCRCLINKRFVPQSRLDRLAKDVKYVPISAPMTKRVNDALDYVICTYKASQGLKRLPNRRFTVQGDNAGSSRATHPTTGDVIIADHLHLSIKHNNLSLKHQKANKLALQLQLSAKEKAKFETSFSQISREFYERWKIRDKFCNVTFSERMEMYDRVNGLTVEYLKGASEAEFTRYITFLLCDKPLHYILNCDTKGERVSVLSTSGGGGCGGGTGSNRDISIRGTFIYITHGSSQIKMRLHTCTSRITPCIGLKYDTRLDRLTTLATFP